MYNDHYLVAKHNAGICKELDYSVNAEDNDDAEDWFVAAKDRLLNVNNWSAAGMGKATFQLMDGRGRALKRKAHKGDYLKMDAPGGGEHWVHIESIVYEDFPDEDGEAITIWTRPCVPPTDASIYVHSYITCAFVVEREGIQLHSAYSTVNQIANASIYHGNDIDHADAVAQGWLNQVDELWHGVISGWLK